MLQQELSALETELADPSNPQLHKERVEDNVDPGELIRGLVDVRGRLDKIRKEKEGRGRLVNVVLGNGEVIGGQSEDEKEDHKKVHDTKHGKEPEVRNIVEMDRRVGELEKLVGSSTAALDEVCFAVCYLLRVSKLYSLSSDISPPASTLTHDLTSKQSINNPHSTSTYRLYIPTTEASFVGS